MIRKVFKTANKCLGLLLLFSVIGFALVAGAYAIPDERILYNASDSTDFLVSAYMYKDMEWMNWPDYYTDMVMLNVASYSDDSKSVFTRAIENEKIGYTSENSYPFEIVRWLSERTPVFKTWYTYSEMEAEYEPCSYGKYWNGYVILLRPLLLFFNMRQIYKIVYGALIAFFAITLIVLLVNDRRFAVPYALAFLTLRPFTKFCLTYAITEILLCIFMIIVSCSIRRRRKRKNRDRLYS